MAKKKSRLKIAQEQTEIAIKKTNESIERLGLHTSELYQGLTDIQEHFDAIRNVPSDKKIEYEKTKEICLNWKHQVEIIEQDYKNSTAKNAGAGVAGISTGVAVVALGPTVAMGVATTFGVASKGTAISTLSGAAATNAALAWLGGGALAAGGGGMAAGNAVLALAGPVGWVIAGVATIIAVVFLIKATIEKNRLEDIFTLISKRDIKSYELSIVEINERIMRIDDESILLKKATEQIKSFGSDYNLMTENQQYELGSYVNLMNASTQLLINPILGLQPKYSESDLVVLEDTNDNRTSFLQGSKADILSKKSLVILLANLLYKIELKDKDYSLLFKSFKRNKKMLKALNIPKKYFNNRLAESVKAVLNRK